MSGAVPSESNFLFFSFFFLVQSQVQRWREEPEGQAGQDRFGFARRAAEGGKRDPAYVAGGR